MKIKYIQKFFSSDRKYLEKKYFSVFGFTCDFDEPKRFSEIINWRKLFDRDPLYTECTDKFRVRAYVEGRIGSEYLIPLQAVASAFKDIDFGSLQFPYIVKTNHGSGDNFVVRTRDDLDYLKLKKDVEGALKKNYYYGLREWQYKGIAPKILVENLLSPKSGGLPEDYKFHCFNYQGCIELLVEVVTGRGVNTKGTFYDECWRKLPFEFTFPASEVDVQKPSKLDEMIDISKALAKDFKYVRVDLYQVEGRVFFGELTFTPSSGLVRFTPDSWDLKLGQKLINTGILNAR